MPEYKVPCFNASNLHYSKIPEFDRQLVGQERGLNDLTVDEYLRGREAFKAGDKVRDPRVGKQARMQLSDRLIDDLMNELRAQGMPLEQASSEAERLANEKMRTLAALHNPDLFAGGKDVISDFGDRGVNSSIGAQWRGRIDRLDQAVMSVSAANRHTIKVNATLIRCK
ncbi:polymorphic toxin type 15 domain-containing protein [Pseudomonas graminis]|uniref:polymorphic toxin type 15 domain-containing protein n=2 Tax=Pseudomonas TaxID=286 RepID=UPI003C194367